jgi:hypothetical protein
MKLTTSHFGPSLRFVAMQQHVGYRGKADSDAASTRQIYGFTAGKSLSGMKIVMPR